MRLPVHRWFRYSAGFSADWARRCILEVAEELRPLCVFDPFVGSGTTLLAAEDAGVHGLGLEAHPFVFRIARAKLQRRCDPAVFASFAGRVRDEARQRSTDTRHYPDLVQRCYQPDALHQLDALRRSVEDGRAGCEGDQHAAAWALVWLALMASLRTSSHVGTAQWQYVLPRKSKKRSVPPFEAFDLHREMIETDLHHSRETIAPEAARVYQGDARRCEEVSDGQVGFVLTSPPYPNNYDYADATRLEMSFLGEIHGWGDLQSKVRSELVRACSQHVPARDVDLAGILQAPELAVIRDELAQVVGGLAEARRSHAGKKNYHLMVACYFHDLARVWLALRRVCASPSRVCFVIGDSAPYGVYVPVIDWLGRLALSAGFRGWEFRKTRDRNIKWKNRKHRVPLCEGQLWVRG